MSDDDKIQFVPLELIAEFLGVSVEKLVLSSLYENSEQIAEDVLKNNPILSEKYDALKEKK